MSVNFVGDAWIANDDAIFYHGFKIAGEIFSVLHYIKFHHKSRDFFGKLQSVFYDKKDDIKKAEVVVFQFVRDDCDFDRGNDDYHEVWVVENETMEIPLSSISPTEITLVHVPANVKDDDVLTYVDNNIGIVEHDEGADSDSDSDPDNDMSDFIVKGEVFGFYQYSIDQNDELHYAVPPRFSDKFLSFETSDDRMRHEFVDYLKEKYIFPKLDCFYEKTPFSDDEMVQMVFNQDYVNTETDFCFKAKNGPIIMDCDLEKTKKLVSFIFLLKVMLTQQDIPLVRDIYNFCLKYEMNV